uniref:aminocyclopropanecarboxylate oxidase n=1 Tax=Wollemia nobilis TaxID=56998 RepID=A0A0C9QQA2_9CONI
MAIPLIDMANINGEERAEIIAQIKMGCESPGFFQLLNHGIEHSLMDRVKKVCKEHYELNRKENFNQSLPVETLNSLIQDELTGNNTTDPEQIGDMDWEDIFILNDMQKTDSWPAEPNGFKETLEEFTGEIYKLAETLLEIISENLRLEKDYLKRVLAGGEGPENKPFFGTKVSYYPPCPRPDLITGLRAHTDAGGLILLFQDDEVPGLQVLSNGEWIDVQPLRHSIVIDVGDQLEVISGGKYKSAWHRILPTKDANRLSVASYYNPSLNTMVYPAPQLAASKAEGETKEGGEEELSAYPKFIFGNYMTVYGEQKYDAKEPRFEAMKELYQHAC